MILGIYCAGGLGRELCDIAKRINTDGRWSRIVFIDDVVDEQEVYGITVIRSKDFRDLVGQMEVVIANGTPDDRERLYREVKNAGIGITSLIDPTAVISETAELGEGVIITPFSTVTSNAKIGNNVLIHSYVRVGHDIEIGDSSVISSNTGIGGRTIIGERSYIALGSVVKENIRIGARVVVSMGSVVVRDVEDGVIVVGNPARVCKKNDKGIVFK